MTTPRTFSLAQQLDAMHLACTRQRTLAQGGTVKSMRRSAEEAFDLERLQAVTRTLLWLQDNEADVRAFIDARKKKGAA